MAPRNRRRQSTCLGICRRIDMAQMPMVGLNYSTRQRSNANTVVAGTAASHSRRVAASSAI
jgi:hypothetical protein